jgi:predicted ABC-type ATPase
VNHPTVTFIAGANGAGKTTLTRWNSELFSPALVLDPDAIANTLQAETVGLPSIAAARQVLATAKRHLETAQSFAVETTLSGRGYLQMMLDAKKRNFDIVLIYIGTEKVEINLQRIRNRVLAGGHDVPENDVRRRYGRSFANLPFAIEQANHCILFDNSSEEGYRLVALISGPERRWFGAKPGWAAKLKG